MFDPEEGAELGHIQTGAGAVHDGVEDPVHRRPGHEEKVPAVFDLGPKVPTSLAVTVPHKVLRPSTSLVEKQSSHSRWSVAVCLRAGTRVVIDSIREVRESSRR
jgi:hypothetical protein